MAQKYEVILIDDIDEGDADETITFALDGVTYEIDLNSDHAAELRESIGTWISYAREVPTRGQRGGKTQRRKTRQTEVDAGDVRQWARKNGHKVSDRGRISSTVVEAYKAAKKLG